MKTTKRSRRDAKQLFRLCLVDRLLDEQRVMRVVQRVIAATSRNRFAILRDFLRRAKLYVARHTAVVQSAMPLPADLQSRLQAMLVQVYGPGLTTTFTQHTELLGGTRIQVGSDVYDGTIRAALAALEAHT
jgi:F-type H+-transporting ATPase subunit delta